jgi:hypothetical protein
MVVTKRVDYYDTAAGEHEARPAAKQHFNRWTMRDLDPDGATGDAPLQVTTPLAV